MRRPALKLSKPDADSGDHDGKESREKTLAAIKAKVEGGTYIVDPLEVSRKIIEKHISKKAHS